MKKFVLDDKTILKELNRFIKIDEGKKYITENDFIEFTENIADKDYVKKILQENNVALVLDAKKRLVKNCDYGQFESYNLKHLDVPKKSVIEYDEDDNVIFSNYDELDRYLESKFLPVHLVYHKKINNDTLEVELCPTINFYKIKHLGFSDEEIRHILEYLNDKGIQVNGCSINLAGEFDNYNYFRTYKISKLPDVLLEEEEQKLFDKYYQIEDKNSQEAQIIKNEIAIHYLKLLRFFSYKYAVMSGVDMFELESYGYEGILRAIEKYDVSFGNKFIGYATYWIKMGLRYGILEIKGLSRGFFNKYSKYKAVFEDEFEKEYDERVKILQNKFVMEEIIDFMLQHGKIGEKAAQYSYNEVNIAFCESLADLDESISDFDLEKVVFQESLKKDLDYILATLSDKEELVTRLRFGLGSNGNGMTFGQIGEKLDMTPEGVRGILNRSLKKLRKYERSKKVKDYYNN